MKKTLIVILAMTTIFISMTKNVDAGESNTWISKDYQNYCEDIGNKYGICPELLEAMIETESSGQANVSNGSCKGLMQVNDIYHRDRMNRLGVSNIYDPYGNILVAADYLEALFIKYGDVGTVLMVYNGSSKAISKGENADYTKYAKKIVARAEELERIHNK